MKAKNIYTSVACNRTPQCADWGYNGMIAYGACNAVALMEPRFEENAAKVLHTLVQHNRRVNTVKWLHTTSKEKEVYLISGADDALAVLWNIENIEQPKYFPLIGHTKGVNAVAGVQRTKDDWLLATAAADSTIKLWRFDGNQCKCVQTIALAKGGFCFALTLTKLPKSEQILFAYSADDETIALWAQDPNTAAATVATEWSPFHFVHKLSGHEDWVRGLDIVIENNDLLLASSSQDNFIRLWRIAARTEEQVRQNKTDIFNLLDVETGEIRVEEKILQFGVNEWYAVSLESILYGHEGWVYGVNWHKCENHGLRLLSASIDKTLIIWELCEDGVWMEKVRVGDVGGNSLGFFGGKFSSDGKSIMGHSYQGGFHIWNQSMAENSQIWTPSVIVGGHFDQVRDLGWEPKGAYLMSVSADQTTRIHAPWQREGAVTVTWHELARPQVHGYDMQALAILSRYKFASGAEEKIVRTFQAPANFIENFRLITQLADDAEGSTLLETLPKGASVPSLGLSNKAVFNVETPDEAARSVKDEYPENYFVPVTLEAPPQEEALMQNTLWPEIQKLYGHGFEIYALAATSDGQLLASTCRATNAEHAQIILWNTTTWKQIQKLAFHQLTVTQLSFSPDAQYLLAVSRDRRWSLFQRQQTATADAAPHYTLTAHTDKSNGVHTRIIWSCDWSHDSKYFATSSRDGKMVIWHHVEAVEEVATKCTRNGWQDVVVLELKNESITAVAFATHLMDSGAYVLAVGLENGTIKLYQFTEQGDKLALLLNLNNSESHHLTVKRLRFKPRTLETETSNNFHLASCGEDNFVRIYEFFF